MKIRLPRRRRRVMRKGTAVTVMVLAVLVIAVMIATAQLRRPPKLEFTASDTGYQVMLLEMGKKLTLSEDYGSAMPRLDELWLVTPYFDGGTPNEDGSAHYPLSAVFSFDAKYPQDYDGFLLADGEGYLAVKDGSSYRLFCLTKPDDTDGKGIAYETLCDRVKATK